MDDAFRGKRVTVAGLGHFGGGIGVARWLVQQGAKVLVTDVKPRDKLLESLRQLDGLPIEFALGEHRIEDFTKPDFLVTSPAIPPTNEYLQAACEAGVPITTEIRLFIERCRAPIAGVTGTKGKSTTTKLLSLMLESRFKVWTGGNIGGSLLFDLPTIEHEHIVVLELSSYMLEHIREMQWSPHVAVVTMLGIDHIAWHVTPEAYLHAKRNIVRFQKASDFAVLIDSDTDFSRHTQATVQRYGLRDRRPFALRIPGEHNQLNAQAAFAAANVLGVSWEEAQAAVRDFPGLPHRLQLVHTDDRGVRWFNDSIATIPEAAVAALNSFPEKRVIQIVGGYDKKLDITEMCDVLSWRAKAALTIGATGSAVASKINAKPQAAVRAALHECGDLETAANVARELSREGDVVLLSPGFASYDQFTNFQLRGEAFARLAKGSR